MSYILQINYRLDHISKKNSLIIAELVWQYLDIDVIVWLYDYVYQAYNFYDNKTIRTKVNQPILDEFLRSTYRTWYDIILIDDSIVSWWVLRVSLNDLHDFLWKKVFFSILSLQNATYTEQFVNDYFFAMKWVDGLIDIIANPEYLRTTHMLRTIESLSIQQRNKLFESIGEEKKISCILSYREYAHKDFLK